MVRTKFICLGVEDAAEQTKRITFQAVNTASDERQNATEENKEYSKRFRRGNINLEWSKKANESQFQKGQEYIVDIFPQSELAKHK